MTCVLRKSRIRELCGGVEEDSVPGVAVRESLTEVVTFDQRTD